MSTKRKHSELDLETVFETLFSLNRSNSDSDIHQQIAKFLRHGKKYLASPQPDISHRTATSFTLEEAIWNFGLKYTFEEALFAHKHIWMVEAPTLKPSMCLETLLAKYSRVYDRSSEAACRVAVDLVLCESISALNGMDPEPPREDDLLLTRPSTPKPSRNMIIKVYCEVSFLHKININPLLQNTVGGRVDIGVAIALPPTNLKPNRRFHSLLFCVEAKVKGNPSSGLPQLVVYLASLRQARINRGKSDSSVYGMVTDGFIYIFVTITHEGVLQQTKSLHIGFCDLPTILGHLQFILEKAIAMSPHASPKQGEIDSARADDDDDDDDVIDLDQNSYSDYPVSLD